MNKYTYYTDGAATMKKVDGEYVREAGGWGFVELLNEKQISTINGGSPKTTNNEMELYAILSALRQFLSYGETGSEVEICSDSAYCINIYTQWAKNWEKNGWTRGKKHEPIENLEIIKETWNTISNINRRFCKIKWTKVIGHNGNYYNEVADNLAVRGKRSAASTLKYIGYRGEPDVLLCKF